VSIGLGYFDGSGHSGMYDAGALALYEELVGWSVELGMMDFSATAQALLNGAQSPVTRP